MITRREAEPRKETTEIQMNFMEQMILVQINLLEDKEKNSVVEITEMRER